MRYILSIDQGTTGTTSALIDANSFQLIKKASSEFPQILPGPDLVEHNLNDIWKSVEKTVSELIRNSKINVNEIECIGITNQRETICAFNKNGTPLTNAIVWQDRRTNDLCKTLKEKNLETIIKNKSGLPIDPYFSATKINWLLDNNEAVKDAAKNDDLLFGTIDTFLLYRLTNGKSFFTEASNASRTLLMNLKTCSWDQELLDLFQVKESFLPEIKESFTNFGKTNSLKFLPDGISITGILGDQQAALFGQAGIKSGDMKCTYGTGAFILLNTGTSIKHSNSGLLSTVAYKTKNSTIYALEGSSYIAGAAVQWLRDNLKIIKTSPEIEDLAKQVKNLDTVRNILFLPFFTGIGSPYWNSDIKAAILGLSRDSNSTHIAHACLEGIALSINDLINAMEKDTAIKIESLKVDGGASTNNLLMSMQATISNLKIIRPAIIETTACGAALAAAVGKGLMKIDEIEKLWKQDSNFIPQSEKIDFYNHKKSLWMDSINMLLQR